MQHALSVTSGCCWTNTACVVANTLLCEIEYALSSWPDAGLLALAQSTKTVCYAHNASNRSYLRSGLDIVVGS